VKHRILIIDDHPIVRERLGELINHETDLLVCGEADDSKTALDAVDTTDPDLALVDISLKDTYGIELVKELKLRYPRLLTLVLSMHDESLYAERALRAGARGYITKQEASKQVIGAIHQVLNGGIYVSEKMASLLLRRVAGQPATPSAPPTPDPATLTPNGNDNGSGSDRRRPPPTDRLSNRELEIFQLLGEGSTVRQIAERLQLSVKTVEAHRTHIKEKLNLRTSPELLRYAIQISLSGQ
jgi:DNA-binding NarL/FixJ family response regulator